MFDLNKLIKKVRLIKNGDHFIVCKKVDKDPINILIQLCNNINGNIDIIRYKIDIQEIIPELEGIVIVRRKHKRKHEAWRAYSIKIKTIKYNQLDEVELRENSGDAMFAPIFHLIEKKNYCVYCDCVYTQSPEGMYRYKDECPNKSSWIEGIYTKGKSIHEQNIKKWKKTVVPLLEYKLSEYQLQDVKELILDKINLD